MTTKQRVPFRCRLGLHKYDLLIRDFVHGTNRTVNESGWQCKYCDRHPPRGDYIGNGAEVHHSVKGGK